MAQHGKKYKESLDKVDRLQLYAVGDAVDLVKELASAKFDETVELAVRLGVDPRKADQIVRGTLSLPEGTGRTNRVAVPVWTTEVLGEALVGPCRVGPPPSRSRLR